MTGAAQPIEWYLAHDNKQYGPLSDAEIMKLVEFRHLKDGDLLWRMGFTDWTPAAVVFPQAFRALSPEPEVLRPPVEAAAAPVAASQSPQVAQSRAAMVQAEVAARVKSAAPMPGFGTAERAPAPAADESAMPGAQAAAKIETLSDYRARIMSRLDASVAATQAADAATPMAQQAQREMQMGGAATADGPRAPQRRMWIAPAEVEPQPVAPASEFEAASAVYGARPGPALMAPSPLAAPGMRPVLRAEPRLEGPAPGPRRGTERATLDLDEPSAGRRAPAFQHQVRDDDFAEGVAQPRRPRRPRRLRGLIAVLMLLAIMTAGAWALLTQGESLDRLLAPLGLSLQRTGDSAPDNRTAGPAAAAKRPPAAAAAAAKIVPAAMLQDFSDSATAIDEMLQAGQLWQIVKAEFPEWYAERVREAAGMVAEKKLDETITKHLVDALISLRRKNADHAFQASLPRLQLIARTFRDALDQLTRHSQVACYSLISAGEGSRGMLMMFRDPKNSPALQTGIAAVFEAIAEGRRTPTATLAARRSDYDVLTAELTALGWKEADIALFADPQALARSTPEQVCRMVREWFTAHLAVQDKDVQRRLLIESVRPVVAG